jgi:hypothetical protein
VRRLTVGGRAWGWRVRRDGAPYPGHVIVRVWADGQGGGAAKLDVRVRFDDPWLNYGPMITAPPDRAAEVFATAPVTPKLVAAAITQALAAGWDPDARGTTTAATWDGERLTLDA